MDPNCQILEKNKNKNKNKNKSTYEFTGKPGSKCSKGVFIVSERIGRGEITGKGTGGPGYKSRGTKATEWVKRILQHKLG